MKGMKDPNLVAIGGRIRAARRAMKLTIDELARRAGVTMSYVGQIERGLKMPAYDTLNEIAKALKTDVGSLVVGSTGNRQTSLVYTDWHVDPIKGLIPFSVFRTGEMNDGYFAQFAWPVIARPHATGFVVGTLIDIEFEQIHLKRFDAIIFEEYLEPIDGELVCCLWKDFQPELRVFRVIEGEPFTWPPSSPVPFHPAIGKPPFHGRPRPLTEDERIIGVALEIRRPLRNRDRAHLEGLRSWDAIIKDEPPPEKTQKDTSS